MCTLCLPVEKWCNFRVLYYSGRSGRYTDHVEVGILVQDSAGLVQVHTGATIYSPTGDDFVRACVHCRSNRFI